MFNLIIVLMKKLLLIAAIAATALTANAQPGGGGGGGTTSQTSPDGATYTLSDGSTVTKSGETISSTTAEYNAVQVTNGTLTLDNCTITKTGDTSTSGDETSFYGVNASTYCAGSNAKLIINGGTITSTADGANAIFCYNGGTITATGVTVVNNSKRSRGLHATGSSSSKIYAYDCDITTTQETSSVIATDRGGGYVYVDGGSYVANGRKCAIVYSTGDMTVKNATGASNNSDEGEIADIEGDNSITIDNCTFSCAGSSRGVMLYQSGSGDADGYNPVMNLSNSTLTLTNSSAAFCEVSTAVNATLNIDNCTLTVPSGQLAYINTNSNWNNSNTKYLALNLSNGTYTGSVDGDNTATTKVNVATNTVWEGSIDNASNISSGDTVVVSGTWIMDKASTPCQLIINSGGTVYTNGYDLDYCNLTNNGTLDTTSTGVTSVNLATFQQKQASKAYNLRGQRVNSDYRGVIVTKDKKRVNR